jgi:putative transposase
VVLPDHLHCLRTLPHGDDDFSMQWRAIKSAFSRRIPAGEMKSESRLKRAERGIWQQRFWEHPIRDDRDYTAHVDYIHFNPVKHGPVKHGLVANAGDWPHSSFHPAVRKGIYPAGWVISDAGLYEAGEQ